MKKIMNDPAEIVNDALAGMAAAHSDLITADYQNRLCLRAQELRAEQVALISGGGSGHEPLHAGFVGEGMLAAAVLGHIFSSPTSDQVFEAARQVHRDGGVLLIVKNYTGDVLNFRAASEFLDDEQIAHRTVIVREDAALPADLAGPGRRGTAATVFVEKIAGAAAESGRDLDEVTALAQRVADSSRSIGFALSSCTTPMAGRPTFDLAEDEIEFGVGIHGERGRETRSQLPSAELAGLLVDALVADMGPELSSDKPLLALTNGLGGTPLSELYVLHRDVVDALADRGFAVTRHLVGDYVTSLDMAGASLSLLPLDDELLALWDAPVHTPAWTAR